MQTRFFFYSETLGCSLKPHPNVETLVAIEYISGDLLECCISLFLSVKPEGTFWPQNKFRVRHLSGFRNIVIHSKVVRCSMRKVSLGEDASQHE
jgi:hypothetical protein